MRPIDPDRMTAAAVSAALNGSGELPGQIKYELNRIVTAKDARAAYEPAFVQAVAALPPDQRFDVGQELRNALTPKLFSILEWTRRIKRAQADLVAASAANTSWTSALNCSDRGPRAIVANAVLALRTAPEWRGVLAYDEFGERVVARLPAPWGAIPDPWQDADDTRLACWMQEHGIHMHALEAGAAAQVAGRDTSFHPVRDYLNGLEWDTEDRLSTWIVRWLGVSPGGPSQDAYLSAVGRMWLISAVARVMDPGCKVDTCLVLEGRQGRRKSSALETLAGEKWFTDCLSILGSKDARLEVHGKWIIEIADMHAYRAAEAAAIRSFISTRIDRFRRPYDRHLVELPRQSVFGATVNGDDWARDPEEERRMWPVRVDSEVDLEGLREVRDQLWAEARACYRAGQRWWITDRDILATSRWEQRDRFEQDAWHPLIDGYLAGSLLAADEVTVEQLLEKPIGMPVKDQHTGHARRVAGVLRSLGWKRVVRRNDQGIQRRVWIRP